MIALVLTCRPRWQPWLLHQLAKQEFKLELVVFDDSTSPQDWPAGTTIARPSNRLQLSLGQKRQCLLDLIKGTDQPFAWFDDDDWHPRERLAVGAKLLECVDAVGCRKGLFCDVQTTQTRRLELDQICFNSAVFAPYAAQHAFQPLHRGEDTCWLQTVLRDATIASSPLLQHCWMSHDGNVTGKRGSLTFEGPRFNRFDAFEKEFLRSL